MIKPIHGSWFEFQHFFDVEGEYWNPACAKFTAEQWEAKIQEMAAIGMDSIVLMNVACHGKAYYETPLCPSYPIACEDPIEAVLRAGDTLGVKFFIGIGYFTPCNSPIRLVNDPAETKRRLQAIDEVAERYGRHASFHGWYWPHEAYINQHFQEGFIEYVNTCSKEGRSVLPGAKTLIGPYGTLTATSDDEYVRQLDRLDVDIIAYQDEVGVEKSRVEETPRFYEELRRAHDRVPSVQLWADVELFRFEGKVYRSALLPAPFERVKRQLEAVSPFVEKILVYQYLGMMNPPDSDAFAGHPASVELYRDYVEWIGEVETAKV